MSLLVGEIREYGPILLLTHLYTKLTAMLEN